MTRQVLSIGQCVPDEMSITRFLKSAFDVHVDSADTGVDGLDLLRKRPYDLVLINRKLDIDYSDGANVLRDIKADPGLSDVPVMMITNYPEHQQNAIRLGAVLGFGKNDLGRSDTIALLEPYLGRSG